MISYSYFIPYTPYNNHNCFIITSNSILREGFKFITSKKGVRWPKLSPIDKNKYDIFKVFNESLEYPEYYLKNFHAYDGGNMNWRAAEECEAATKGVMSFHYPESDGDHANSIVRGEFMDIVSRYVDCDDDLSIVDMASGIGYSTSIIDEKFNGNVVGIEMSPYYLNKASELYPSLNFIHGNVENTKLDDNSQDIVFISYLLHELPEYVSENVINEARRVLKPFGILAVLDMNSNIKASSIVSQYIFDRTEPYLEEYKSFSKNRKEILERNWFTLLEEVEYLPKTSIFIASRDSYLVGFPFM